LPSRTARLASRLALVALGVTPLVACSASTGAPEESTGKTDQAIGHVILPPHLWIGKDNYEALLSNMSLCDGSTIGGTGGYWVSAHNLHGAVCTFTWWTNSYSSPDTDALQAALGWENLLVLTYDPSCNTSDGCSDPFVGTTVTGFNAGGGGI